MKKRFLVFFLILCLLLPSFTVFAEDSTEQFSSHFTYYDSIPTMLIGDLSSDHVLLEKNADQVRPIASMSKMVTYYVVKDAITKGQFSLHDRVLISSNAAQWNRPDSSNFGLKSGENYSIDELLTGLMVVSGNDCAVALAEKISGSEEEFANLMKSKMDELGFTSSTFINASGFTENGMKNSMSAKDLYAFTRLLVKVYPEVLDYTRFSILDDPKRNYRGESTISKSMQPIDGLLGLKTGFTDEAGYCFTGVFDLHALNPDQELKVITIVMGAPSNDARYRTTKEMVEFSAGTFQKKLIIDSSLPFQKYEVDGANEEAVILYPEESFSAITYINKDYHCVFELKEGIVAPTVVNQVFGLIKVYKDEELVKEINLISHKETTKMDDWKRLQNLFEDQISFLLSIVQN